MCKLRTPWIEARREADFGFGILPWAAGPMWELCEAIYSFHLLVPGYEDWWYHAYAGYWFNKASIPPWFWGFPFGWIPDGLCTVPALGHDLLCDYLTGGSYWLREKHGGVLPPVPPAWVIHEHFYRSLLLWGVKPRKAWLMWVAVAAFGPGGWARPSSIWKLIKP